MSDTYEKRINVVDLTKNTVTYTGNDLLLGDMFYYNQVSIDQRTGTAAFLGKEHVHFVDVKRMCAVSIMEDDGDHPAA